MTRSIRVWSEICFKNGLVFSPSLSKEKFAAVDVLGFDHAEIKFMLVS
jgi:hypothetical protein